MEFAAHPLRAAQEKWKNVTIHARDDDDDALCARECYYAYVVITSAMEAVKSETAVSWDLRGHCVYGFAVGAVSDIWENIVIGSSWQ